LNAYLESLIIYLESLNAYLESLNAYLESLNGLSDLDPARAKSLNSNPTLLSV